MKSVNDELKEFTRLFKTDFKSKGVTLQVAMKRHFLQLIKVKNMFGLERASAELGINQNTFRVKMSDLSREYENGEFHPSDYSLEKVELNLVTKEELKIEPESLIEESSGIAEEEFQIQPPYQWKSLEVIKDTQNLTKDDLSNLISSTQENPVIAFSESKDKWFQLSFKKESDTFYMISLSEEGSKVSKVARINKDSPTLINSNLFTK